MEAKKAGQCTYDVVGIAIDAGTAGPNGAYAASWVAYVGGELVFQDPTHQNGWDYDRFSMQATFYGDACARLHGEGPSVVTIVGADCPHGPK